jgi:hypothetical protein
MKQVVHEGMEKYVIVHDTEIVGYISKALCDDKKLSYDTIKLICETHAVKYGILIDMQNTDVSNVKALKEYAEQLTEIEYTLQRLWGFPENSAYHKFWLLPHCKCPRMDNQDRYATGCSIIDTECPVHGSINA